MRGTCTPSPGCYLSDGSKPMFIDIPLTVSFGVEVAVRTHAHSFSRDLRNPAPLRSRNPSRKGFTLEPRRHENVSTPYPMRMAPQRYLSETRSRTRSLGTPFGERRRIST